MSDERFPQPGHLCVRRKTGERFEVWAVYARWVVLYPDRAGNRRPVHVPTNNFGQEFDPESA